MNEYVISREELRKWCSVPVDELGAHPDRPGALPHENGRMERKAWSIRRVGI